MQISGTDQIFWILGFLGQMSLVAVLLFRREYKRFIIFSVWILLLAAFDPMLFWFSKNTPTVTYYRVYLVTQVVDYILQFGVLVEIAHTVLKPGQERLSNRMIGSIGTLLLLGFVAVLIWALHQTSSSHVLLQAYTKIEDLNFIFSFLRLILFALIAGFSQMLGITWKNHVIRLAAGLAFYSAVSLIVQLTLSHLSQGNAATYTREYWLLNHTEVTVWLCALTFWVWSFLQKDAPRREFTPQMQRVLVTISQAARRNRVSLTRSMGHK